MSRTRIVLDPGALDRSSQRVLDLSVVINQYRLQLAAATAALPSMPPEVRSRVSSELAAIGTALLHVSRAHSGSLGSIHRELRATARALGAPGPKIHTLSRWWKVGDAAVATGDFFGVNVLAYAVMGDQKKATGQAAAFGMTVFGGHIIKGIGKGGKAAMGAVSGGARAGGRAVSAGAGGAMKLLGSGGAKLLSGASRGLGALTGAGRSVGGWTRNLGRLATQRLSQTGGKIAQLSRTGAALPGKWALQRKYYNLFRDVLAKNSVHTPKDKAVFYSGTHKGFGLRDAEGKPVEGVWILANEYAKRNKLLSIGRTPAGGWLDQQLAVGGTSPISQRQANKLWRELSERMANEASGNVTVLGQMAQPNKVFREVELPTLLKNPKVTEINGMAKEEWARLQEIKWADPKHWDTKWVKQ